MRERVTGCASATCVALAVATAFAVLQSAAEPKTILGHGWDLLDSDTSDLLANADALDRTGLDGVSIRLKLGKTADGAAMDCTKMRGAPRWREDAFDRDVANIRELVKHRSMRKSMLMAWWGTGDRLDWRDDARWADFAASMAVVARLARKCGLPGIVIDPEDYNRKCQFQRFKDDGDWNELNRLARMRGRQMSKAIFDAFPKCRLLTFWTFSEVEPCLFQDPPRIARAYDDLRPAFFNGMMDGLSDDGVIYDGDEFAYTIRADRNDFYRHAWLMKDGARPFVAPENATRFDRQWLVSFGLYPDMHVNPLGSSYCFPRGDGEIAPVNLFAMNVEQAAKVAPDLIWIYGEHRGWIRWKGGKKYDRYNKWGTWDEAIPGFTDAIRYGKDPAGAFAEDLAAGRLKAVADASRLSATKGEGGEYVVLPTVPAKSGDVFGVEFEAKGRRPRAWIFWHVDGKLRRGIWPVDIATDGKADADGFERGAAVVRVPATHGLDGMELRIYADHGAEKAADVRLLRVYPIIASTKNSLQ